MRLGVAFKSRLALKNYIAHAVGMCYSIGMGNHRAKKAAALWNCRRGTPSRPERKEGDAMITYQDLFLFCTFIVALISLIYQILKDKRK